MRQPRLCIVAAFVSLTWMASGAAWAFEGFRFEPPTGDVSAEAFFVSHGWQEQRGSWDRWRFQGGALHIHQDADSTTVGRRVDIDPKRTPTLRFRFRVQMQPEGADLRKKDKEDSALRVFVVFAHGGGLLSPPDTIAYAFGDPARRGQTLVSERFDNVKYIVVAGGVNDMRRTLTIERNLATDYRAAFGSPAPHVRAIAIKADANNVGGKVYSILYGIEIVRGHR